MNEEEKVIELILVSLDICTVRVSFRKKNSGWGAKCMLK